ncbi:terpene synthase family protein [Allokutzneria oryzae]|uniref:Terpene synthase n=1 Tax=Allokutzneria oryzae TaxID=1378989 RepID=A0ABV6A772_9PSEU
MTRTHHRLGATTIPCYGLDLYCPFPLAVHPEAASVEEHLVAWERRFSLTSGVMAKKRFEQARLGRLAACMNPVSRSLAVDAEWVAWGVLLDDMFDDGDPPISVAEAREIKRELLAVVPIDPEPTPGAELGLAAALGDLWCRVAPAAPLSWRTRFVRDLGDTLDSLAEGIADWSSGTPPSVEACLLLRRRCSGIAPTLDLIEVTAATALPEEVVETAEFRSLRNAVNDVVCVTNDVFSLSKDLAQGEMKNIVIAMRHAERLDLAEAVDRAVRLVARRTHDFERAERDLSAVAGRTWDQVERVVESMRYFMSGCLDWHRTTSERYSGVGQW